MAELLGRSKSTISRELHRNRGLRGYRPDQAHNLALMRRQEKIQPRLSAQIWQQVEALIREWSPEQIVGPVEMEGKGFLSVIRGVSTGLRVGVPGQGLADTLSELLQYPAASLAA